MVITHWILHVFNIVILPSYQDESHNLKNIKTSRTKSALPILQVSSLASGVSSAVVSWFSYRSPYRLQNELFY